VKLNNNKKKGELLCTLCEEVHISTIYVKENLKKLLKKMLNNKMPKVNNKS
jgi:hypothetical protein